MWLHTLLASTPIMKLQHEPSRGGLPAFFRCPRALGGCLAGMCPTLGPSPHFSICAGRSGCSGTGFFDVWRFVCEVRQASSLTERIIRCDGFSAIELFRCPDVVFRFVAVLSLLKTLEPRPDSGPLESSFIAQSQSSNRYPPLVLTCSIQRPGMQPRSTS